MGLAAGTRLGPYELVSLLGAGGMGEVYRARDTRLDRTVAIKILNAALVATPDAKVRFEREAKTISQLNHSNICTLYDVGHQDGTDYLVMEFLEGETLSDRLASKGALPLQELTRIGSEIADALDKAHRAGIIHRDLKPGNVMLTKAGAKLLDFGLAKPAAMGATTGSGSAPLLSAAMTMTSPSPQQSPLTQQGSLVGTVQYMSPEQFQGMDADARSDIFALGAVLYEIATGRRAFDGKSQIKVASAILEDEPPPVSTIQRALPAAMDRLIRTCLAKNPDDRFQSVRDVKLELQWAAQSALEKASVPGTAGTAWRAAWIVTAAAAVLATAAAMYFRAPAKPMPVLRTTLLPPDKTAFVTTPPDSGVPVLSPDGSRLAFVARDAKGALSLYVRAMNSLVATQLAGTDGAIHPFWSPDSRNIAFFSDGKLKRIEASGGRVQELAPADRGRGGAWSPSGIIVYAPSINGPLMRVPASGGTPSPATKLLPGETGHRWPSMLPDANHFVFWVRGDKLETCIGSLDSLDHKRLFENASNATYASPGYLLFLRSETLMAQPFSAATLETTGDATPLVEHVALNSPSYRGVFSTSDSGMLVYQSGSETGTWHLQWVDRSGKAIETLPGQATFFAAEISPDEKRIAVAFGDYGGGGSNIDVWILDIVRGTRTRLTFDSATDNMPIWTPDGRRIIYSSNRKGKNDIYMKSADGSGNEEIVLEDESDKTFSSISQDGRYIAYQRRAYGGSTGDDIWVLPLFGDRKPFPLVQSPFMDATPQISPDGKWLAYSSDESHRREIYITSFPGGGAKWQVSTAGGLSPKWRGDSKEVYFLSYDGSMNAVDVSGANGSITLGAPHALFADTLQGQNFGPYDVSPDGKRFLLNGNGALDGGSTPLTVLTNWIAELKK